MMARKFDPFLPCAPADRCKTVQCQTDDSTALEGPCWHPFYLKLTMRCKRRRRDTPTDAPQLPLLGRLAQERRRPWPPARTASCIAVISHQKNLSRLPRPPYTSAVRATASHQSCLCDEYRTRPEISGLAVKGLPVRRAEQLVVSRHEFSNLFEVVKSDL